MARIYSIKLTESVFLETIQNGGTAHQNTKFYQKELFTGFRRVQKSENCPKQLKSREQAPTKTLQIPSKTAVLQTFGCPKS